MLHKLASFDSGRTRREAKKVTWNHTNHDAFKYTTGDRNMKPLQIMKYKLFCSKRAEVHKNDMTPNKPFSF